MKDRLEAARLRALVESRHRDARSIEHCDDAHAAAPAHPIGHDRVLVAFYPDLFGVSDPTRPLIWVVGGKALQGLGD